MNDDDVFRPRKIMSWNEYGHLESLLLSGLDFFFKENGIDGIDLVIGIYSGGIILAKSLSTKLKNVPLTIIKTSRTKTCQYEFFGDINLDEKETFEVSDANVLLVDDISDSGLTFKNVLQILENYSFNKIITATLIQKTYSAFKTDTWAKLDESKDWIVFPWE